MLEFYVCYKKCGHLATHFISIRGISYPICDKCSPDVKEVK